MAESEYKPIPLDQMTGGIKLSEISEIGAMVPVGRYKVKLSRVEAKDAKSGVPMVVAGFDVLEAFPLDPVENKPASIVGLEASAFYSMYVGKSEKNGRIIAPGIMEFKAAAAAVGRALPDDFIFPSNVREAARLIHDTFHPKNVQELEAVVIEETDRNDKTKKRTRTRIIGRWGASGDVALPGATQSATADTFSVV